MDELRYRTLWTCYVNIWLGFWLLTAHVAFGYLRTALAWSDTICGILVIVLGIASLRRVWAPWFLALIGIWLQFAPLVFWAKNPAAYANDTVVGALLIALSILIPGMPGRSPDSGPSVPPGWTYNPSSWPQRLPVVILGTAGWFISRYLAAEQLGYIDRAWDPVFGMGTLHVISSSVSRAFPVSDAGLGAMAYTLEVLFALKGGEQRWRTMPWMVVLFGLIVVPLGFTSITLIILQPLVVGSWCTLCLCTAFCMTIMIAFAIDEVVAVLQFLRQSKKPFWNLFWKGDCCPGAKEDSRTPKMDQPFSALFSAAAWGINVPWNLFLSALIGAYFMLLPWILDLPKGVADRDHIVGAFIIVVSIISMAEVIRKLRYINILLGAVVLITAIWLPQAWAIQSALAILLILLSLRRGRVREEYGSWKFF